VALTGQTVELVIDEIVLDGVEPGDASVPQALAHSLGPAFADHGLAESITDVTGAVVSAVTKGAAG
jgi:hypothetical protein